ncbi:hypothetical protein IE4803_CH02616 [Rhizobium etli bv. phaseoli str. IE4803]|nr:hypothetical protein IE4803_CH02616 [Rhizobium etli bv. phaseoli str. IE4803]
MSDKVGNAKTQVENTWRRFWDDHKDFDAKWVRHVLHNLAEYLPFVFEYEAAKEGFTTMLEKSRVELLSDFDWTIAGEDLPVSALEKLRIYRLYLAVRAYAFYGLKLEDSNRAADWETFLDMADLGMTTQSWLRDEEAKRSFSAARARLKLDHPEWLAGLSADEVAALAGVSRKSVMNLLAPKSGGTFQTRTDGSISVESARAWLEARPDFRPSIWHLQEDLSLARPGQKDFIDGDPVWVPVAKDGTWFSPEHALPDGCFHVVCDNYREEQTFDDYWEALDFLSRATSPLWRCPDEAGRWHLKSTSRWDRKTRQEIQSKIGQTREEGGEKS